MKKIILTFVAAFCFIIAEAQFSPGQKTIGGDINYSHQGEHDTSSFGTNNNNNYLNAYVSVGKFVTATHEEGFLVSYNLTSYNFKPNAGNYNTSEVGIGYFSECYKPLGKNFYFTLNWISEVSYIFGSSTQSDTINYPYNENTKGYQINTGLYPGVSYKWNKHWLVGLDLMNLVDLNYLYQEAKSGQTGITNSSDVKTNTFGISTSLNNNLINNLSFEFRYIF